MAEEFKLSHTAAQIDAKLNKIDSLAEKSELPTKTSDLANDSGFATENYVQKYAQPIGDYALKGEIPSVDLSDYALKSEIPTDYLTEIPEGYVTEEELQNKGFLTEYIETDPSVPAWAKAEKKPTYSAKEVGALPADTVIPVKTSDLVNDSGFITGYSETDPTVPSWAKQPNKPVYTAEEVGALPSSTVVPTKVSELENDRKFLTEYVETDPSVPAWAKSPNKPIYTAEEVGALPSNTVIPTVPTNVSAFTNDAGYLTEHQSLDGLATEAYVNESISGKADKTEISSAVAGLASEEYVNEQVATKADSDHTHDYNDLENKTHYIDKELNLDKSGQYTVTKQIYVDLGYPDVIVCTCDGVEYTLNEKWVGGTGYWGYDEFQAGTSPVYFESNATGDAQSINVVDDGKAHEVVYSTYYATNVYVPLDERFIPETIARASDVATKADVVHSHSWDDLEDKPFYEGTVLGDTLTWDGNAEGLVTTNKISELGGITYYKISDITPLLSEMLNRQATAYLSHGSQVTIYFWSSPAWLGDGSQMTLANAVTSDSDVVCYGQLQCLICLKAPVTLAELNLTLDEPGVYMPIFNDGTYTCKMTIPGFSGFPTTVDMINESSIPDTIARVDDIQTYVDEAILGGAW